MPAKPFSTAGHRAVRALSAIRAFKHHLASAKFQGTEPVCNICGAHTFGDMGDCVTVGCDGYAVEERKDWISTTDVLRWLDTIDEHLRYDLPELRDTDA